MRVKMPENSIYGPLKNFCTINYNILYAKLKAYSFSKIRQMSQSIQEWTKPLKDLKEYGLLKADHTHSKFLEAFFHKFYLVHS